jgi:polyisoprenoid-binding protein YceI
MAWQLDPMHTQVEFAVKHFGMMTVRGRFNDVKTRGTIDPEHPENPHVEVTIDVASLNTNNADRDNHLRGSNFLELEKYPTMTFRSTKIEWLGADRYTFTGDLTITGSRAWSRCRSSASVRSATNRWATALPTRPREKSYAETSAWRSTCLPTTA